MSRKLFHEDWALVATIDPIDANNADSSTDIIDMSLWEEVVFVVMLGVINASATFDFAVYEDEAASMSGEAAMSGKSITQFTGGGSDGAKQALVHVKSEELSSGCRYIRGTMANSAHSQLAAVVAFGRGRFQPASDGDLSSVDEIVI